ncbi:Metallo-dependent phosphatase-like protein [Gamsiella multidivaricata]|uniref:Metallo-dependent phosphatase-like protein n=1 Tax=Gamsiella multidivaricata TaxID=101098 RepID=UPI0022210CF8|nr:Metallo-dependent phosphatase-like protein [Gamsiella multidivaricata]KAI7820917.1 Metallo-dependent phosphatase-like protein [Gamsiella multidivaricata]
MRINIPTVILSLAVASSVYAAPTPVQLEKRGVVLDNLKELFTKAIKSLECGACVAALVGAKDVAYLNKSWVLDAAAGLCSEFKIMPKDVCTGLVYTQGPVLVNALMQASLLSGDGKHLCHQVLGACPAQGVSSGTLTFPKPKPANVASPTHSGNLVDVLHLSDWHVDNEYVPGAEGDCNRPLCCRKYADSPATPKRAASTWGDYKCDSPVKLGQDLLKYVPKVANVSFTILTGDVPPHDVWKQNKESVVIVEEVAYSTMKAGLSSKVYPTVGNHETGPTNLFPTKASGGDISWLYASLADDWSRWLPADAVNSVKNYGAYTVSPTPGFRIISLNTNFCYTMNFYLYGHTDDYDPNGELKWLVTQLQAAEDAGERVWIISHVGPSQTDCLQNWSALYYQAVQRYSPHVIAEQFFGHTHYDEFALYYGPGAKNTQNAIATGWIGPSVTPYTDLNPGFRVYKVDTKSWNVFDAQTYIADLNQAASWDASGSSPNWHLEYSARKAYGAYAPIADNAPLSASWWHNVTAAFESNDAAFQQYWTYRGKSAGRQAACAAGGPCPKEIICNLRAGRSSDACSGVHFSLKRSDEAEASDATGLHSLYKRADPKPWNKKLCGLTPEL